MKRVIRNALMEEIDRQVISQQLPLRRLESVGSGRRSRTYVIDGSPPNAYLEIVPRDGDEAFSADVLWSHAKRLPRIDSSFDPEIAARQVEGSLRIALLWSNGGLWWTIEGPPPPIVTRRSVRDIFRQADQRIDLEAASRELPDLVADFLSKVRDHVLPYVARLRSPRK